MLIGSPFVNDGIIKLTDMVSAGVRRSLVTRTDLRDFAIGASSLGTLCTLAKDGVKIYSLKGLHAKIYVFDDTHALVTSANATTAGMWRNLECGLFTSDRHVVRELACLLLGGLGADAPPSRMKHRDLDNLYGPLGAIRVSMPEASRIASGDDKPRADEFEYSISDTEAMVKGFTGWKRLTLEGVLAMPEAGFHLGELLEVCEPAAARRYPSNRHVPDKLRQQLQVLRDVGIVDFVEPGYYRRTMNLTKAIL